MSLLTLTPADPIARDEEFLKWLQAHSVDPTCCYRIEFDPPDKMPGPPTSMSVFLYALNEKGEKYIKDVPVPEDEAIVDGQITKETAIEPVQCVDIIHDMPEQLKRLFV